MHGEWGWVVGITCVLPHTMEVNRLLWKLDDGNGRNTHSRDASSLRGIEGGVGFGRRASGVKGRRGHCTGGIHGGHGGDARRGQEGDEGG